MFSGNDIKSQSIRYLTTGLWNTLFGILVYTALIKIFGENRYLLLAVLSNIISITNAYICYKIFVFKTKGNIIKEYLKCYIVYGLSMLIGIFLLYIFVDFMKIQPVTGNIISVLIVTIISLIGHKYFSFRCCTIIKECPEKIPDKTLPDKAIR